MGAAGGAAGGAGASGAAGAGGMSSLMGMLPMLMGGGPQQQQPGLNFPMNPQFTTSVPGMGGQGLQAGGGMGLQANVQAPLFNGTNLRDAVSLGTPMGSNPIMGKEGMTDEQKRMLALAGMSMMNGQNDEPEMPMQAPPPFMSAPSNILGRIPGMRQAQPINSALLGRYIK